MLPVYSKIPPAAFSRNGNDVVWFGQPCVLIDLINEGSSFASLVFVHRKYGEEAQRMFASGGSLSTIFEARRLPGMEEFDTHFLCCGLYRDAQLIGMYDVPLIWADGRQLMTSADLDAPDFKALMNAAADYARLHPAENELPPDYIGPPQA